MIRWPVTYLNLGRDIGGATWWRALLDGIALAGRGIRNAMVTGCLLLQLVYGRVVDHGDHGHAEIHLQTVDNGHANGAEYGEHIACGHKFCKEPSSGSRLVLGWVRKMCFFFHSFRFPIRPTIGAAAGQLRPLPDNKLKFLWYLFSI